MKAVASITAISILLSVLSCREGNDIPVEPTTPTPIINPDKYQYDKSGDMPYRLLLPRVYDASRNYPLLLFLHGAGQRGNDNENQLTYGATLFLRDSLRVNYPAFVVFPQCPTDQRWETDWALTRVEGLLAELQRKYPIDKTRIYIGGLSNGTTGTYALVPRNPDLFAASFAIAGHGDENKVSRMTKTRWWVFQGENDQAVTLPEAERMVGALKKAGASVKFTVYRNVAHESWNSAFAEPDFCQWLFSNHK